MDLCRQQGLSTTLSNQVRSLIDQSNTLDGAATAEFVQTLQRQNDQLFIEDQSNISTFFSGVLQDANGNTNVVVPFGLYNAGLNIPGESLGVIKGPEELGVIASSGGIEIFLGGDLLVNEQRVVGIGTQPLSLFSLFDNLDAGRGSSTTIAASTPIIQISTDGSREVIFPPNFAGSGVRKLNDRDGNSSSPALFTPYGVVDAGDAGITSDSGITIAAIDVQNSGQIQNSNGDSGSTAPPAAPAPVVDAGASTAASSTSENSSTANTAAVEEEQSFASNAAAFLNVFILGVGDGTSDSSDSNQNDELDSASTDTNNQEDKRAQASENCLPDNTKAENLRNCVTAL